MLRNPAYKGRGRVWQKHASDLSPPGCGRCAAAASSRRRALWAFYDAPTEDWISISVPRLVDPALFDAVREQLAENSHREPAKRPGRTLPPAGPSGVPHLRVRLLRARRSACALRKASGATTPITDAAAPTPTVSAASACARTPSSAPTVWTRRSGARSSGCCTTRPGSPRNTSAALDEARRRGKRRP